MSRRLLLASLLACAFACGSSQPPPAEPVVPETAPPGESTAPAESPPVAESTPTGEGGGATPAPPPVGKPCKTSADCGAAEMCQGPEGCAAEWTCAAVKPCTRDLVSYCGCDGKEFKGSGTCPPKPYSKRGPCGK